MAYRGQTFLNQGMCNTDTSLHGGLFGASVPSIHVTPLYNENLFFLHGKEGRDLSF